MLHTHDQQRTASDIREELAGVQSLIRANENTLRMLETDRENPEFVRRSIEDEMSGILELTKRLLIRLENAVSGPERIKQIRAHNFTLRQKLVLLKNDEDIRKARELADAIKELGLTPEEAQAILEHAREVELAR